MKRKRRTNVEILKDMISECADRIEKTEIGDFDGYDDLHDTYWNATNINGKLCNMWDKAEDMQMENKTFPFGKANEKN